MVVRRKHIRHLVDRLLSQHQVRHAPVPVVAIAEALGIVVHESSTQDGLSGFLYRDRKQDLTIIGVNADHHSNRKKFTTAHELGHYLLHDFQDVHVDRDFKVWLRSDTSSKGTEIEEKEANLFAAELLMPTQILEREIRDIGHIDLDDGEVLDELAGKYGVSVQAMTFRLAYLGYIEQ